MIILSYVRFFETLQKDFTLNVFLLFEFKRLRTVGFSCSNTSMSITTKAFLKHTCQRQIASLLLLCKQGNIFNLSFQEQVKKKKNINEDKSDLLSCCYSYSYKKLLYYKEIFNNTLYIQEKKSE